MQGGLTYADVTEQISAITEKKPPEAVVLRDCRHEPDDADARSGCLTYLVVDRHRRVGQQQPGRLGLGHHELRLVDRHRPRRHADLGDPVPVPPEVADVHQPRGRGDDAVRRGLRGPSSRCSTPAAPWRAIYWLFPMPNADLHIWQNFRSPLMWDVFAVSTYGTVSLLFWFTGLIPDLATLRDRATSATRKMVFGILSLGWRGSASQWRHYELAYLILAGLSTPLVLSVHSIVSFDFAVSLLPGWHTTIFPPYFVAGAIFSGFAMVVTLLILARWVFNLENLITIKHLDNMCKMILATGSIVGYAYAMEFFIAWYSGNPYERFAFINRAFGPYCLGLLDDDHLQRGRAAVLLVQEVSHEPRADVHPVASSSTSACGSSASSSSPPRCTAIFCPLQWGYFRPTWVDICTFAGTIGLFLTLFLLFLRFLPADRDERNQGRVTSAESTAEGSSRMSTSFLDRSAIAGVPEACRGGPVTTASSATSISPEDLLRAIRTLRTAGFTKLEAYSPFPIHGIDEALGEPRSPLGRIVFVAAMLGLASAIALQWWTGAVDYKLVIAGKPFFAFEPSVPIMFELTVLFGAFGAVLGMFHLNRLPTYYHSVFQLLSSRKALPTIDSCSLSRRPIRSSEARK